jgi:hypothetical protein
MAPSALMDSLLASIFSDGALLCHSLPFLKLVRMVKLTLSIPNLIVNIHKGELSGGFSVKREAVLSVAAKRTAP